MTSVYGVVIVILTCVLSWIGYGNTPAEHISPWKLTCALPIGIHAITIGTTPWVASVPIEVTGITFVRALSFCRKEGKTGVVEDWGWGGEDVWKPHWTSARRRDRNPVRSPHWRQLPSCTTTTTTTTTTAAAAAAAAAATTAAAATNILIFFYS